jgi:predicted HAD superfamily Cof-like phosphohydrolase
VVYGAGHAFGIDLDDCFNEVHSSNMTKLGADGRPLYRDDGKVMKGPNYREPDLTPFIL